jgi:glucose-1-phosphate cytidylyltransferase
MKAVLLAGGLGTRISEESHNKPKPMIEIGTKPILWHIMKMYSQHGVNDFIICCGYKGYLIKEYFANYALHQSDVTFNLKSNELVVHSDRSESWTVTLVDTGENSMTGGRLLAVKEYLKDEDIFCLSYGDGVSDIDIKKTIEFHKNHKKKATISAVYPPGRFGALEINNGVVSSFIEKPEGDGGMINGGFFVLSPKVLDLIDGPNTIWEQEPLKELAMQKNLMAYEHYGFWQPMDTLRDKELLEKLWKEDNAPWKIW